MILRLECKKTLNPITESSMSKDLGSLVKHRLTGWTHQLSINVISKYKSHCGSTRVSVNSFHCTTDIKFMEAQRIWIVFYLQCEKLGISPKSVALSLVIDEAVCKIPRNYELQAASALFLIIHRVHLERAVHAKLQHSREQNNFPHATHQCPTALRAPCRLLCFCC